MTIETFKWCPRLNAEADVKHRVRTAQFGDGYSQVSGDGINSKTQQWTLSFTGNEAHIAEIMTFLDRMAGMKSFYWKPPLYPTSLFRCAEYKQLALGAGKYTLNATFTQAFKP
ncbi:phage tail protein [Yersinia kristensenii]|uniref:phage tail protein n=1 Tax=Yersinia kristensenii TaxID=28152 RepID=UPI0011A96AA6|nr:phage tail protein [Yersinia kristensenii]MDR4898404.1 phage tail protein [Yersinia kristensenii]MDX6735357.1 phage tail protein [Yersinia kristensenii]